MNPESNIKYAQHECHPCTSQTTDLSKVTCSTDGIRVYCASHGEKPVNATHMPTWTKRLHILPIHTTELWPTQKILCRSRHL